MPRSAITAIDAAGSINAPTACRNRQSDLRMERLGLAAGGIAAFGARGAGARTAALMRAGRTALAVGACPARALENLPGAAATLAFQHR